MSKPSSCGQKWSDEEEIQLLELVSKKLSIYQIAKKHNRTTGGITARLKLISEKLLNDGFSIKDIIKVTGLNELDILTNKVDKLKKVSSIESSLNDIKKELIELKNALKKCSRCGRNSHNNSECYASSHLAGWELEKSDSE
jgi:hypothetical protein